MMMLTCLVSAVVGLAAASEPQRPSDADAHAVLVAALRYAIEHPPARPHQIVTGVTGRVVLVESMIGARPEVVVRRIDAEAIGREVGIPVVSRIDDEGCQRPPRERVYCPFRGADLLLSATIHRLDGDEAVVSIGYTFNVGQPPHSSAYFGRTLRLRRGASGWYVAELLGDLIS